MGTRRTLSEAARNASISINFSAPSTLIILSAKILANISKMKLLNLKIFYIQRHK